MQAAPVLVFSPCIALSNSVSYDLFCQPGSQGVVGGTGGQLAVHGDFSYVCSEYT
jgi:hypothetical protein